MWQAKRAGLSIALLVAAATSDAYTLSRGMWAEFNAIYLMNLAPTAYCSTFRARSLALLGNDALAPKELDAKMRALWKEARDPCLETTSSPDPTAAAAVRKARPSAEVPSRRPEVVPTLSEPPVPAAPERPGVRAEGGISPAASRPPEPVALPPPTAPPAKRPATSHSRPASDCEAGGPAADGRPTGDGACEASGRGDAPVRPGDRRDAQRGAATWHLWLAASLAAAAAAAGVAGAALWWLRRRRRAPSPTRGPVLASAEPELEVLAVGESRAPEKDDKTRGDALEFALPT